jgi:hypothetical protein
LCYCDKQRQLDAARITNNIRLPTDEIENGISGSGRVMKAAGQPSKASCAIFAGVHKRNETAAILPLTL